MICLAGENDGAMAPKNSHSKFKTCLLFRRNCANLQEVETEGDGVLSVTGIAAPKMFREIQRTE